MPTATGLPSPGPPRLPGRADPMPDGPRAYPQLLRGGRQRWWKPLLALLLAVVGVGIGTVAVMALVAVVLGLVLGVPDLGAYVNRALSADTVDPGSFLALNLGLAVLIPVAGLTIWAVHRVRPGYVSSVQGGLRWRWLLRCTLVLTPLWAGYLAIGVLLDPPAPGRPPHWVALLVIVVLTTPLQAAGEEYFFRGFLLQNFGAWFSRPVLALVVPGLLSAGAFAAAHGSPDPWVLADLGAFALGSTVMAWRTGGLEAGIVLHAVNNMLLFAVVVTVGGWEEAFVGEDTTSTPGTFAVSAAATALSVAVVWWQARRVGLQRLFLPPGAGEPTSASAGFVAGPVPLAERR